MELAVPACGWWPRGVACGRPAVERLVHVNANIDWPYAAGIPTCAACLAEHLAEHHPRRSR